MGCRCCSIILRIPNNPFLWSTGRGLGPTPPFQHHKSGIAGTWELRGDTSMNVSRERRGLGPLNRVLLSSAHSSSRARLVVSPRLAPRLVPLPGQILPIPRYQFHLSIRSIYIGHGCFWRGRSYLSWQIMGDVACIQYVGRPSRRASTRVDFLAGSGRCFRAHLLGTHNSTVKTKPILRLSVVRKLM